MKKIIINDSKYKSIFVSVNFLLPLEKENMSKNALIAMILKKNSQKYKTEKEIERKLADMYNADLKINALKYKGFYNIEFGIEFINKKFIGEDVLEGAIEMLKEIIKNPIVSNNAFPENIVKREKESLINIISEQKDQKRSYAMLKIEELVFEGEDYGYPVLGKVEDVEKNDAKGLYEYYLNILETAKIVAIVNGNLEGYTNIESLLNEKLTFEENSNTCLIEVDEKHVEDPEIVKENQDISQSVLSFGLKLIDLEENEIFKVAVLNAVLGGSPSSKLFQNIREKASLAYYAKSIYNRQKGAIYVIAGIEPKNYEKAKKLIEKEINSLIKGEISEEELKTAKDYVISTYREMQDNKSAVIKFTLSNEIMFNKQIDIEEIIRILGLIEKQDLEMLAKKINIQKIYLLGGREDE